MTAEASAGTSYSASYSMSTRIVSPSGTTAVTSPTGTPRIRTSLPSKRDTARLKWAVAVRVSPPPSSVSIVATSSRATTSPTTAARGRAVSREKNALIGRHRFSGVNSPLPSAPRLTAYASNHGPVPMMLDRMLV